MTSEVDSVAASYDQTPYLSQPFEFTHPARMSALAALLGIESPPVKTCRVLEVGCASGGNLLPMAVTLPDATFIGIDISQRQVTAAIQTAREIGLTNIEFRKLDLREAASLGEFDYIIAH